MHVLARIDHLHQRPGEHDHVAGQFRRLFRRQLQRGIVVDRNAVLAKRNPQGIDVVAGQQRQAANDAEVGVDLIHRPAEHGRQRLYLHLTGPGLDVGENLDGAAQAHILDQLRGLERRSLQRNDRQRQHEHRVHVAVIDRLKSIIIQHSGPIPQRRRPHSACFDAVRNGQDVWPAAIHIRTYAYLRGYDSLLRKPWGSPSCPS